MDFFTYADKRLDDGREITVVPLTFGRARITIGVGMMTYDDGW